MIKKIDKYLCIGCGMCEKVCQMDIFRPSDDGTMSIAYQADCCTCLECKYVCPTDAIEFVLGIPKKYDMGGEWEKMKELMGLTKKEENYGKPGTGSF